MQILNRYTHFTCDIPAVTFPTDTDESLSNLPTPHRWQTIHQDRLVALSLTNKVNPLPCHGAIHTARQLVQILYCRYCEGRLVLEHTGCW